jgi:hypothetical protein
MREAPPLGLIGCEVNNGCGAVCEALMCRHLVLYSKPVGKIHESPTAPALENPTEAFVPPKSFQPRPNREKRQSSTFRYFCFVSEGDGACFRGIARVLMGMGEIADIPQGEGCKEERHENMTGLESEELCSQMSLLQNCLELDGQDPSDRLQNDHFDNRILFAIVN